MNISYSRTSCLALLVAVSGCSTGAERVRPIEQGLCQSDPNDPCCPGSPIILDLDGNGFDLTDLAGGVHFNLNPGGSTEQISWTVAGSDDAWLALDRNGNGFIDDGTELFGNFTAQPSSASPQGYLALGALDQNHDSVIDSQDTSFKRLLLWQDRNHDGVSDPDELSTLDAHGILGLNVSFVGLRKTDEHGNLFRYGASVYRSSDSRVGEMSYDVFLITQSLDQQARQQGAFLVNGAVSIGDVESSTCPDGGGGGDQPKRCPSGAQANCVQCEPNTFKCIYTCKGDYACSGDQVTSCGWQSKCVS
ncbi:MAG TPA: hypothetical protein VLM79_25995 [Kofleriaceae bacterium]|nr:hypothetical protein [Kofleriaceae bacterium]